MFLAHFSKGGLGNLLEKDTLALEFWIKEAYELHKVMNPKT